jgi:hypothetical protein
MGISRNPLLLRLRVVMAIFCVAVTVSQFVAFISSLFLGLVWSLFPTCLAAKEAAKQGVTQKQVASAASLC